ncbi:hypothetical protein MKX01_009057 [Papaver californicum]|nr:hypothetical protein MKX01_009057 [Papaver californicum]
MQNCEEVNMDIVEDIPSLLERFSTLQNLYQLQRNLDEKEKLVLKDILDNAVTQLVQSHVKTDGDRSSASTLNCEKQQDAMMEDQVIFTKNKVCSNCGKIKKFKTAATKVMTEVDVIRRFKASGHPGDDKVIFKDRDEILGQSIGWKNQTQQRTTNPPLLAGKLGSDSLKGGVRCRQREHKYCPPQDVVLAPTLMNFEPHRVKVRPNHDRIANSSNVMTSGAHKNFQGNRRISTTSSLTSAASSCTTLSTNYNVSCTEDHRKYQQSRRRSMSSSSLYSASSTGSLTQTTNYSRSYTSSEEVDSPPQRTMQLDRYCSYRSRSRSRTPQTHYSRSTRSCTSSSSSPAEDYPVRRRSRHSKVDPPQKKMGHFGRLTKKIAGMFDHYHSDDTDASSSKEDRNAQDLHHSVQKPVGNGVHHPKSKDKQMQKRKTAAVKSKPSQQGHFRTLAGRLYSHIFGSKKSKPSSAGTRRLERAVTGKKKVKSHWWQNFRRRGLPNKRGKARLKLGVKSKHTQLKGRRRQ